MRRNSLGILLSLVAALGLWACGNDGGTSSSSSAGASSSGAGGAGSGAGTSSNSSSTGTSSSSSTASSSTASSSSSGAGGGGAVAGTCAPPCTTPAECCPPGSVDCPGGQYPNNVSCENGACKSPQCSSTSDCTAVSPKLDCFTNAGVKDCAFACASDVDCTSPLKCAGVDDNGKKYCIVKGTGGCTDAMCASLGLGKCINNVCSCLSDSDCTKSGFTKCAK